VSLRAVSSIQQTVMRSKGDTGGSISSVISLYERCKHCAKEGRDYIESWY
jgi:hypothetical protein